MEQTINTLEHFLIYRTFTFSHSSTSSVNSVLTFVAILSSVLELEKYSCSGFKKANEGKYKRSNLMLIGFILAHKRTCLQLKGIRIAYQNGTG